MASYKIKKPIKFLYPFVFLSGNKEVIIGTSLFIWSGAYFLEYFQEKDKRKGFELFAFTIKCFIPISLFIYIAYMYFDDKALNSFVVGAALISWAALHLFEYITDKDF